MSSVLVLTGTQHNFHNSREDCIDEEHENAEYYRGHENDSGRFLQFVFRRPRHFLHLLRDAV